MKFWLNNTFDIIFNESYIFWDNEIKRRLELCVKCFIKIFSFNLKNRHKQKALIDIKEMAD